MHERNRRERGMRFFHWCCSEFHHRGSCLRSEQPKFTHLKWDDTNMPLCSFCSCCWLFFNLNAHFLLLSTGGSPQASGALHPGTTSLCPFQTWRSSRSSLSRSLIVRNGLSLFLWHIFSLAQWKCLFFVGIIPDPLCLLQWLTLILSLINSSILFVPRGKPSVSSLPLRHLHPCLYFHTGILHPLPPRARVYPFHIVGFLGLLVENKH